MKSLRNILVITLVTFVIVSCKNQVEPEVKTIETEVAVVKAKNLLNPDATFIKSEFTIDGMTCEVGCARTIQKKIARMDGVKSATVDFERKLAMVEYDEAMVNHTSLEATVSKAADIYKVSDMKTVDDFSTVKECEQDCTKACCKDKTEVEKKACTEDCKKACCVEKKIKA